MIQELDQSFPGPKCIYKVPRELHRADRKCRPCEPTVTKFGYHGAA